MATTSDYDQRQYRRMIETIANYEMQECSLATLVSNIEGLVDALEGITTEQRNELLSCSGIFEEVYAVSLDQGLKNAEVTYAEPIAKGIRDLKQLIEEQSGENAA